MENIKLAEQIKYEKITNDVNGNPRFLIKSTDLGVVGYPTLSKFGLYKYRGKRFECYTITSYNILWDLEWIIGKLKENSLTSLN